MTELTKDANTGTQHKPACWFLVKPYTQSYVYWRCPEGGHLNVLEPPDKVSNTVDASKAPLGTTNRPIECKHSGYGCKFKDYLKFKDWDLLFKSLT